MAHPDEALRPPAEGLEASAEWLGRVGLFQVHAAVLQARQCLVRERHQGIDAELRVLLDPDHVKSQ